MAAASSSGQVNLSFLQGLLGDDGVCDPFDRLSALEHDAVMLVEFSELIGPKPAFLTPSTPGPHFSASDFALWLMTADYQMSNKGPFGVVDDIDMLVHNEEQGVHCYSRYFSLFDIDARGFIRPFCLAYLTPNGTSLDYEFSSLHESVSEILHKVKCCNRRQFMKELTQAIEALHTVENQAISSYYELYYDKQDIDPRKVEEINMRTRRLMLELNSAYKSVCDSVANSDNADTCRDHPVIDMDPWITRVVHNSVMNDGDKVLKEVSNLFPCVSDTFFSSLCRLWSTYRRHHPYTYFLFETRKSCGATVNLDGLPILTLPPSEDSKQVNPVKEAETKAKRDEALFELLKVTNGERSRALQSNGFSSHPSLLCSVLPVLPQLLFPVLCGHFVLLCSSDMRRPTLTSLLNKLRLFIPSQQDAPSSINCLRWHEGRVPATAFADYKLFGLKLKCDQNLDDMVASNIKPFLSVLDLNSDVFTSPRYQGTVLNQLIHKKSSSFKDDSSLIAYSLSLVGQYAMLAYVLYYFMYCNQEVYRKNLKYLPKFVEELNLGKGDMKIVKYFVELIKFQYSEDQTQLNGAFESLFLDNDVAEPFKL